MAIKGAVLALFAALLVAHVAARSAIVAEIEVPNDPSKLTYGRRSWLRAREHVRERNPSRAVPQRRLSEQELAMVHATAVVDATAIVSLFDAPVIPTGMVSLHGGNVFTSKSKKYGMKSRAQWSHREMRKRSPVRRHIYANRHKYIHT